MVGSCSQWMRAHAANKTARTLVPMRALADILTQNPVDRIYVTRDIGKHGAENTQEEAREETSLQEGRDPLRRVEPETGARRQGGFGQGAEDEGSGRPEGLSRRDAAMDTGRDHGGVPAIAGRAPGAEGRARACRS